MTSKIRRSRKGFAKVRNCCKNARERGLDYVWIDTCCIDKSNSAELSEAINSMFVWYENAIECYVYMYDIPDKPFEDSVWFTRGWTLQELIAPERELFYDKSWAKIGDKTSSFSELQRVTKVSAKILCNRHKTSAYSIAQLMSWASKRTTTRVEDRAYSLLGIFGLHMPMLYGEGKSAFQWLQEELMKRSDDLTILWWTSEEDSLGLLAPSPSALRLDRVYKARRLSDPQPFAMTNTGLSIELMLIPLALNVWAAVVGSSVIPYDYSETIHCIFLQCQPSHSNKKLQRIRYDGKSTIRFNWSLITQFRRFASPSEEESFDVLYENHGRHHSGRRQQCMIDVTPAINLRPCLHGIEVEFYGNNDVWGPEGRPQAEDVQCIGEYDTTKEALRLKSHPGLGFVFGKIRTHRKCGNDNYSICFAFGHDGTPVCLVLTVARTNAIDINCSHCSPLKSVIESLGEEVQMYRSLAGYNKHLIACLDLKLQVYISNGWSEDGSVYYIPQIGFAAVEGSNCD